MSASLRPSAPKSIPVYEAITALLTLADHGTAGAVSDQGPARFDLSQLPYHEGLVKIEAKSVNGQGGTPTSPGAAASFTFHYAFANDSITPADAPVVLQNIDQTLTITLPNSNSSAAAGTRYHAADPFVASGRYLYIWYDRTAFAANALVDLTVSLIRC